MRHCFYFEMEISTKKKVSFQLDNVECNANNETDKKKRTNRSLFNRVPNFSTQHLLNSLASTATSSMIVKEDHKVDLEKLTLEELNNLLQTQKKIVQNKLLLSKLKDKGEKAISYYNKLNEAIKLRQDIESVNESMNKLSFDVEMKNSDLPIYHQQVLQKNQCSSVQKRFNIPNKLESTVKVKDIEKGFDFKDISIKLRLPKEIQTLDVEQSLKELQMNSKKEKNVMKVRLLELYDQECDEDSDDTTDEEIDLDEFR